MHFKPILKSELPDVLTVVKQGLFEHINDVFGWDDDFQRQRLHSEYEISWFHWIYANQNKIGLVCFKPYSEAYHVHLLLVFPEYRQQKYGEMAMRKIQAQALNERCKKITLSSFSKNTAALSFYAHLGYEVVENEGDFVSLSLELSFK